VLNINMAALTKQYMAYVDVMRAPSAWNWRRNIW
jgi:chromatin segregation and condensation protein Rec8/ScpA/Scc1 (kleisin family)